MKTFIIPILLFVAVSSFALYAANKRDNARIKRKEWYDSNAKQFDSLMIKAHFYLNKKFKYELDSLLFNTNKDSVRFYNDLQNQAIKLMGENMKSRCPY